MVLLGAGPRGRSWICVTLAGRPCSSILCLGALGTLDKEKEPVTETQGKPGPRHWADPSRSPD